MKTQNKSISQDQSSEKFSHNWINFQKVTAQQDSEKFYSIPQIWTSKRDDQMHLKQVNMPRHWWQNLTSLALKPPTETRKVTGKTVLPCGCRDIFITISTSTLR